jgi:hypothetical protein
LGAAARGCSTRPWPHDRPADPTGGAMPAPGRCSKRTRNVMQGSVLIPTHGRSSRFRHEADHLIAPPTDPERRADQRLRWSASVWSPPPESNRRPHPYHGSEAERRAIRRPRRSQRTVGGAVMCLDALRSASPSGSPLPGHVEDGWAGAALRKVTAAPIPNELVAVLLPS